MTNRIIFEETQWDCENPQVSNNKDPEIKEPGFINAEKKDENIRLLAMNPC